MLRTWRQAQLAENKYMQQAFSQGLSVAGEESLKTPSNNSTTKEEEGVHLQAVNATVARPSGLSSAADSATYENKNQATLKPNLIKISSEKKQVTATAVNPFTENDKSAEFPGMMTIEDEKPTTQSAAKVQKLSLSTQGWGLRTFWRQPLSPVHETNSIVSSEEDSGRHSACSLAVSSGLSNKVSTEALKEVQRKRPDDLDQSIGLPGNLTLPDDPCFKEMRSIMQLKSESGNQNTLSDSDELISSSVSFDTCDDSVFDTAPIQCLSPQISPVCKKGSKRNRMANSRRISVLPLSLASSPPSDAGKENVSGIQNASAFKEELVNSWKASDSEVQLQSTSSVLKPVENLSEWRKLKQSTSELCVDHHEQENLQSRTQFLCKNSEKSFTHLGCNESSVIGNHLVSGRPLSTMWDLTASGNGNVDLDERGQVNRRALSCMNLRSHDSYSDYAVDLSSFDFESSSAQLNEDTADTATSRIFEEFEAACVANRGDLEKVAAANEESGIVESTCMSAESAIHASPWMSRKLKPLQHASQKSPSERPILGAVAAHWVNPESAEPQWDGKGIPNSTTKYKEDQKVSWHTTPFEIRLERALATEVEVPQRNLFRWMA
ncbi:hypothetical protein O6H91_05G113500 [Diphasiastrum complanatum]|nr:hypothetical protein O6H91_05G113500 [Diphasiastrum complanatum]